MVPAWIELINWQRLHGKLLLLLVSSLRSVAVDSEVKRDKQTNKQASFFCCVDAPLPLWMGAGIEMDPIWIEKELKHFCLSRAHSSE